MANAAMVRTGAVWMAWLTVAVAGAAEGAVALDGRALTGAVSFAGKDAVVGGARIALADLDTIDLVGDTGPRSVATPLGVWLVDGGWLPAAPPRAAAAADTVAFDTPAGAIELPLTAILAWGPVEDQQPTEAPATGDRVIADGSTIDGAVQGLGEKGLALTTSSLGDLVLPLAGIQRLRLGLPAKPPHGTWLAVALDRGRPPVALLPGRPLRLACAKDAVLTPPDAGWHLRVEGGRRVYLSGLEPSAVEEKGAFGTTWRFQRDHDLDGGPLVLAGARYARGLVVHSRARLAWNLDGQYERLRAMAGISDLVGGEGDCAVRISGDGKPLWTSESVVGGAQPSRLDLDLHGVKDLELLVDYGARYDIGDHFALADAYLIRKP